MKHIRGMIYLKKIISIFLIASLCFSFAGCKNSKDNTKQSNDVIAKNVDYNNNTLVASNYNMTLKLDTDGNKLTGNVNFEVTNNTSKSFKELHIRNYAASISSSKLDNFTADKKEIKCKENSKDKSIITAFLNDELKPNNKVTISMSFETQIPKKQGDIGYNKLKNYTIYNLSFCFPCLSMYANDKWFDHPYIETGAESNISAVADYTVSIEMSEKFKVVATGKEERTGSITTVTGTNLREFAAVVSDGLVSQSAEVNGAKINYHYFDFDGNKSFNEKLFSSAVNSFKLYSEYIGACIFDEVDVVQTFMNSAMEYPGLVMMGLPDFQEKDLTRIDVKLTNPKDMQSRVAHEMAHQWFYAAIGNNPYLEPWLDEGIAEFFEDVIYQNTIMTSEEKEAFVKFIEGYIKQVAGKEFIINKSYTNYEKSDYSLHVYEGGKMFLYELKKAMGEDNFQKAIKKYFETYKYKIANTEGFVNIFNKYDDGTLKPIFEKYIG